MLTAEIVERLPGVVKALNFRGGCNAATPVTIAL